MDFAGAIERGEFIVEEPREQHKAIGRDVDILGGDRLSLRPCIKHRLQHRNIIIKKSRGGQSKVEGEIKQNFRLIFKRVGQTAFKPFPQRQ